MAGITTIRIASILILVLLATLSDIKSRKIPNKLTLSFILIGMSLNTVALFPAGIKVGLYGLVAGFLVLFIPYIMKAMGAGDVKLMAAIGALTGWEAIIYIAFFTAVSGGVIILGKKALYGGLIRTMKRTGSLFLFYFLSLLTLIFPLPTMRQRKEKYRVDTSDKSNDFIPYAVAIASGTLITLLLSGAGFIQGLSI